MKYQIPPDPQTPAQLCSRRYMASIIRTYHNLTIEEKALLEKEADRNQLNAQQTLARYMQLERPSYLGVAQLGFSRLGDLNVFENN